MLLISISYSPHQPLQNRTIPLAFRRVRVCVCCLVSHPCETMGTHAKASLPCLPLPLHQSLLFSLIFVKEHLSLALLAPPVAPNTAIPTQPLQKNNNPSLNTFPTNQKTAPHHRCGLTYSKPYCIAGLPPSRLNISIPARLSKKLTAMNSTTATTAAIHTVLFCFFVQVC